VSDPLIKELKNIRVRLTRIYMKLGNPKDCAADMILRDDISKFKKKQEKVKKDGQHTTESTR